MSESFIDISKIPHINRLSEDDCKELQQLIETVSSNKNRYNRNKRIETFSDILNRIRKFCERRDENDANRYLVCGVTWLNEEIAINTRQFRLLIAKSKSSINGAFVKMSYITVPTKGDEMQELLKKIPFLKGQFNEIRQWTIRKPIKEMSDEEIKNRAKAIINPTPQFQSPTPKVPIYFENTTLTPEWPLGNDFKFNDYCSFEANLFDLQEDERKFEKQSDPFSFPDEFSFDLN